MSTLNLTWLIPIFPLLAFVAIALGACRNRTATRRMATGAAAISFVLAQVVFWKAALLPVGAGNAAFENIADWFTTGTGVFEASVWVDPLTAVMLFAAPLICLLVFVYSTGYTRDDPRYSRFFAYLSLLAAGMLGLVVSGNLLMLFLCWEVVGLCSYLLIGLRVEEKSSYRAGLKAFLVAKVGDVFLLLGLLVLYSAAGSLQYRDIFDAGTLETLARTRFLDTQFSVGTGVALLIFGGVVSQAAQFPLHVWLPDAVETPAPASAFIQSATTTLAGVYLMARCFPLYTRVGGEVQTVMVAVGAFTALLAALIATTQDDVRRVLAFSTISQLGYVVVALGAGAYIAGVFHLVTHAFFKALLVLGAGSVTHAISSQGEGGVSCDPHDVKNMGGLARRQPVTCWTFVAGALSLSGFPLLTTGFWSQERVLNATFKFQYPTVFWMLAVTAGLTAFYAARLLCLIFLGQPRSEIAANARESQRSMTAPLVLLVPFVVCLGWGGLIPGWFYRFVGDRQATEVAYSYWQPSAILAVFALGGLLVGYLVYGRAPLRAGQMDRLEAGMCYLRLGWLYDFVRAGFHLDQFYQATLVRGAVSLARACACFEREALDGIVGFVAKAGRAASRAAGRCDTLVVDGVVRRVAWMGQATSEAAGHFDVLLVNRVVNLVGQATQAISDLSALLDPRVLDPLADAVGHAAGAIASVSGTFDTRVVDGAVEGMGSAVSAGGRLFRYILQTDRPQNYRLVAFISVLVLVATYLAMVYSAWW